MGNSCGCQKSGPSPQGLRISLHMLRYLLIFLKCALSEHKDVVCFNMGVSEIFYICFGHKVAGTNCILHPLTEHSKGRKLCFEGHDLLYIVSLF